jgi:hypothetical protein
MLPPTAGGMTLVGLVMIWCRVRRIEWQLKGMQAGGAIGMG